MKTSLLLSVIAGLTASSPRYVSTPLAPIPCTMSNGQPRPYTCEFQIVALYLLGNNNEVVGTLKPGSTTVKLPKSKAVSYVKNGSSESFSYTASLAFRRINPPSFVGKPIPKGFPSLGFYKVQTSNVDFPISPGELTVVKRLDVSPNVPSVGIRPNRVTFMLQMNYSTGGGATLIAPVKYVQVANPITFTKLPASVNQYRDQAEAFMAFNVSVDMTK